MLITGKQKVLSIGLCGPSLLLYVTMKPPVAWPQAWEVSGDDDCVCGTKEAGFNLTFTQASSAPQSFCVFVDSNVFSGNDTSFCEMT